MSISNQFIPFCCDLRVHLDFEVDMEYIFERPYYRGNKWVLKLIGQWPFQSRTRNRCLRCMTLFIIGSIVLPKVIKLFESVNDMDIFVECIPMLGLHSLSLIKFINWTINEDCMRRLVLAVERDWKSLKLQRDIQLLDDYTRRGQKTNNLYASTKINEQFISEEVEKKIIFILITFGEYLGNQVSYYETCLAVSFVCFLFVLLAQLAFISTLFGILVLYLSSPAIPKILDHFLPLNESRSRIFLYQTEYFIDQDKYYIHLLIHAYMTVPVSLTSIVFFDNLFAIFINHTCGMLAILKIHLESLTAEQNSENPETSFERLKLCLHLQTDILQFVKELESSYTVALLFLVGVNMAIVALTGVIVITSFDHTSQLIRFLAFHIGTIFHLFWSSWLGHNLIVQSESVFRSAYLSEWYNTPKRIQLMLLSIMMRSLEPCKITAGAMYVMSMQSFGAAMRTTVSFLTLLLSV